LQVVDVKAYTNSLVATTIVTIKKDEKKNKNKRKLA